jgi:rhodanese-related sulfurtransferase
VNFSKDVVYTVTIAVGYLSQFGPFFRKALSCTYGIVVLTGLVLPGLSLAASAALSCQATETASVSEDLTQPSSNRPRPIADALRERCRKPTPALKRLIQSGHAHIVDLRDPQRYQKSHLPDSINIPEYRVKTKDFLKNRPLVLVGEGFDDSQHFETCIGLLDSGFKDVTVLEGGVTRWQGLLGTAQAETNGWELPIIGPREAFTALRSGHWTVVTVLHPEREKAIRTLFPEQDVIAIDNLLKQEKSTLSSANYLIVSEDGSSDPLFAARLKKRGIVSSYWLEGGAAAYSRFVQNRMALLAKLRRGPAKPVGCGVL